MFDSDFIEAVETRRIGFTGGMKMHAVVLFERYVVKVKEVFWTALTGRTRRAA